MKRIVYFTGIVTALSLCIPGCKPEEQEEPLKAPEATYTVNDQAPESDVININADTSVKFEASITNTDVFTCAWYIGEEKVSNITSFNKTFDIPGTYAVKFEATNEAGKCDKTFTVNVAGAPLEVTYSVTDEPISTVINQKVIVTVTVTGGDLGTSHSWKIDGVEKSTTATVEWTPDTPGTYTLSYFGKNSHNETAQNEWSIVVADLPMEGTFTPAETSISRFEGAQIEFSANVTAGTFGLVHSWKVNDEIVAEATGASFKYTFTTKGKYTVIYYGTNTQGGSLTNTWTVTVDEQPEIPPVVEPEKGVLTFDDFESGTLASFYSGNANALSIVDNPYQTASNNSAKVLCNNTASLTSTSSYLQFSITNFPDGTAFASSERAKYDKLRVKVYLGETGCTPLLRENSHSSQSLPVSINGIDFDPANPTMEAWNAAIKTNDWNVLIYDLNSPGFNLSNKNFATVNAYQFRVTVDLSGQNAAGAITYFDDIEFLEIESSGGNEDPGTDPGVTPPATDPSEGIMFDHFELKSIGVDPYYEGNNVGGVSILQVVANPKVSEINPSAKVLADKTSLKNEASSGYFKFKIDTYPDGTAISSADRAKYTRIRVKVYLGTTGYTPLLQEDSKSTKSLPVSINGIAFDSANPTLEAWNAAIKTDDWNVFIYDLTSSKYSSEINSLADVNQFQFRVTVDFNNNSKAPAKDFDVCFDDIEFLFAENASTPTD